MSSGTIASGAGILTMRSMAAVSFFSISPSEPDEITVPPVKRVSVPEKFAIFFWKVSRWKLAVLVLIVPGDFFFGSFNLNLFNPATITPYNIPGISCINAPSCTVQWEWHSHWYRIPDQTCIAVLQSYRSICFASQRTQCVETHLVFALANRETQFA